VSAVRAGKDTGPGIVETSIVMGLAVVLALVIVIFFGGQLAQVVGALVDVAHGGR
jgi:hypothetical protein